MIKRIINCENDLIDAVYDSPGVIIYGLGTIGKIIFDNLSELFYDSKHNRNVLYAVTDDEHKKTTFVNENEILTVFEAVENNPDYPVIVATVDNNNNSMIALCEKLSSNVYIVGIKYYAEKVNTNLNVQKLLAYSEMVNTRLMRIEKSFQCLTASGRMVMLSFMFRIILLILFKGRLWIAVISLKLIF